MSHPGGSGTASLASSSATPEPDASVFNMAAVREFTPSGAYDGSSATVQQNGTVPTDGVYDAYSMSSVGQSLAQAQYNPYADETTVMAGAPFYPGQTYGSPAPPVCRPD